LDAKEIHEGKQTPSRLNSKGIISRYIVIKMLKVQTILSLLREAQRDVTHYVQGILN
jgi:hypothetical protein